MKNTQLRQLTVSCFDVENTELKIKLQNYNNESGATRDQLARSLVRDFMAFVEKSEASDESIHGVSSELRQIVANGLQAYASGGSFDLTVGGVCNDEQAQGRPKKINRDNRIRNHIVVLIDGGASVTNAAQQVVDDLNNGTVEGLPVLQMSAGTVRRIWYASTQQQLFDSRLPREIAPETKFLLGAITRISNGCEPNVAFNWPGSKWDFVPTQSAQKNTVFVVGKDTFVSSCHL
tara:strand:- start:3806 stop:4507 length:702 start_codon:yes stop_codon:yes gene_type:complete